ncbi:MAG: DUF1624 domain-containing protein [Ruminococcaceae bacterium]|nr:DUF1624 domain-containing protein [Oscillospiraceae bacterium]
MKKRIWELDALRGLCVLGMVIVHFVYDLVDLYQLVPWQYPAAFLFVKQWGGVLFLLISGICVTLGSHCIRRGLLVFACGLVCTAVTFGMYKFDMATEGIIIYFGVLHCLGVCMLLWPLFRRLPRWALLLAGLVLIALGLYVKDLPGLDYPWLMPLGLPWKGFASSDYFPLLPNLGFFLAGSGLGMYLYQKKQSLLPRVNTENFVIRFLLLCGKNSLWIYLLHQPLLSGIFYLIILMQS